MQVLHIYLELYLLLSHLRDTFLPKYWVKNCPTVKKYQQVLYASTTYLLGTLFALVTSKGHFFTQILGKKMSHCQKVSAGPICRNFLGHFFTQNFWVKKRPTVKKYQQALYVEIFCFERGGVLKFLKRPNIVNKIIS